MTLPLKNTIRRFVVENFLFGQDGGLRDSDSLLEQGIIDSTGVLELVSYLEKTFHIEIQDDELIPENLDSVESLASFVQMKTRTANV